MLEFDMVNFDMRDIFSKSIFFFFDKLMQKETVDVFGQAFLDKVRIFVE